MTEKFQVKVNTHLHSDKNYVELNMQKEDELPPFHAQLEPDGVVALAHQLGNLRVQMQPSIEGDQPPAKTAAPVDPRFWVQPEPLTGGVMLAIRDPRFGWLCYAVPPKSVKVLHTLLNVNVTLIDQAAANPVKPN